MRVAAAATSSMTSLGTIAASAEPFLKDLEQELVSARTGMHMLMNSDATGAETLFESRKSSSAIHHLCWSTVAFIRAIMTFSNADFDVAFERLAETEKLVSSLQKQQKLRMMEALSLDDKELKGSKINLTKKDGSLSASNEILNSLTEKERNAMLARVLDPMLSDFNDCILADVHMMVGLLQMNQDAAMSYFKGGMNLRKAYKDYEHCLKHIEGNKYYRRHSTSSLLVNGGSHRHRSSLRSASAEIIPTTTVTPAVPSSISVAVSTTDCSTSPAPAAFPALSADGARGSLDPMEASIMSRLQFLMEELESSSAFGQGLLLVAFSLLPPKTLRVMEAFGIVRGDRQLGLELIVRAAQMNGIRSPFSLLSFLMYQYVFAASYGVLYSHGVLDTVEQQRKGSFLDLDSTRTSFSGDNSPHRASRSSVTSSHHLHGSAKKLQQAQRTHLIIAVAPSLLERGQQQFPDGAFFLWVSGRATRDAGRFDESIQTLRKAVEISEQKKMPQLTQMCAFDLGWVLMCNKQYKEACDAFGKGVNEASVSVGFCIYAGALNGYIHAIMNPSDITMQAKALSLFESVQKLNEKRRGKSVTTELFAFRKATRFLSYGAPQSGKTFADEQRSRLFFPMIEMLYFWGCLTHCNGFLQELVDSLTKMEKERFYRSEFDPANRDKRQKWRTASIETRRRLEKEGKKKKGSVKDLMADVSQEDVLSSGFFDEYACLCLWKGVMLRELGAIDEAIDYLQATELLKDFIEYEKYAVPFSLFELALLYARKSFGPSADSKAADYIIIAEESIARAQSKHSNYDFEERLSYRLHCLSQGFTVLKANAAQMQQQS